MWTSGHLFKNSRFSLLAKKWSRWTKPSNSSSESCLSLETHFLLCKLPMRFEFNVFCLSSVHLEIVWMSLSFKLFSRPLKIPPQMLVNFWAGSKKETKTLLHPFGAMLPSSNCSPIAVAWPKVFGGKRKNSAEKGEGALRTWKWRRPFRPEKTPTFSPGSCWERAKSGFAVWVLGFAAKMSA